MAAFRTRSAAHPQPDTTTRVPLGLAMVT
eukprot:SAG31_NODE_4502_length_3183_cov_1.674125_1_plen_28_part_10